MMADIFVVIDIDDRFREELRELQLASVIILEGNQMLCNIAERLLAVHAPKIIVKNCADTIEEADAQHVMLMSLEDYGTAFMGYFLEENSLLQNITNKKILLSSIPESVLFDYAKKHSLVLVESQKSDIRIMLDAIAQKQPQTYFSLAKSAKRLLLLRNVE